MKKMRRIIPAFAMLMVAAIMLSTASFAWFTIGTYATATGMSVTAEAASSLLIINGDVSFANGVGTEYTNLIDLQEAFQNATNAVEFEEVGENLQPATAYDEEDTAMADVTTTNGLVTLEDATYVDQNTGMTLNGYGYTAAAEGTNYIEYTAYIAAAGINDMTTSGNTLQATVTLPGEIAYINKAVTIAFWVADTKNAEVRFAGATNLLAVQGATDGVKVNLGTQSIPNAITTSKDDSGITTTTLDYVKVYIRVYYDGALPDGNTGKTFVRNEHIGASGAAFDIRFDYTTAPAESD